MTESAIPVGCVQRSATHPLPAHSHMVYFAPLYTPSSKLTNWPVILQKHQCSQASGLGFPTCSIAEFGRPQRLPESLPIVRQLEIDNNREFTAERGLFKGAFQNDRIEITTWVRRNDN